MHLKNMSLYFNRGESFEGRGTWALKGSSTLKKAAVALIKQVSNLNVFIITDSRKATWNLNIILEKQRFNFLASFISKLNIAKSQYLQLKFGCNVNTVEKTNLIQQINFMGCLKNFLLLNLWQVLYTFILNICICVCIFRRFSLISNHTSLSKIDGLLDIF